MSNIEQVGNFVAHVYEEDYRAIQMLVKQYPNIETGGDLFGLWKNENIVVIQHFIGPGKQCSRTTTSFHQDIDYLHKVGSLITTEEGLCNVGEWHSHHQIGMPEPSGPDRRTVFSNMPHLGLERFVLFIATIESKGSSGKKRPRDIMLEQIKLRPFLFINSTNDVIQGEIEIIPGKNPHHLDSNVEREIKDGAEKPTHGDDDYDVERKKSTSGEEKSVGKGRDRNVKEQEKRGDPPTLRQQSQEMKEKHSREATPEKRVDHYAESDKDRKEGQRNGRFNNENQSPNTSSGEPERRRSPPPQTQSGGSPRNMPTTTSPPQGTGSHFTPTTVMQTWKNSQQVGTTQGMGRGGQEKIVHMASPAMSQPTSFPQSQHFSTAQGQGRDVHDPHSGFPPYSQSSQLSRASQNQGRQQTKSYPHPGPSYPQQRSQQSPRSEATMPHPSYSTRKQAPAQYQPGCVPIGKVNGKGFF